MADLLLTEELFLLTHDDVSGRGRSTLAPGAGEAGALLLDLADAGLIQADGKKIVVAAGSPAVALHPLLADAFAETSKDGKSVGGAVSQAVLSVQAAVMVAVMTPVIVSS